MKFKIGDMVQIKNKHKDAFKKVGYDMDLNIPYPVRDIDGEIGIFPSWINRVIFKTPDYHYASIENLFEIASPELEVYYE